MNEHASALRVMAQLVDENNFPAGIVSPAVQLSLAAIRKANFPLSLDPRSLPGSIRRLAQMVECGSINGTSFLDALIDHFERHFERHPEACAPVVAEFITATRALLALQQWQPRGIAA